MAFFSDEFAKLVVCPVCRQSLAAEREGENVAFLRCTGCGKRYPVIDGIPILLAERAIEEALAD
jgi:uncharacterized protein YbaR (Trm112 family)